MTNTIRAASLGAVLGIAAVSALLVGGIVSAQEMEGDNMEGDNMMGDNMMVSSYSDINKAVVITDDSEFEKIRVYTGHDVPTDGSAGAFGYGVITSAGLDAIIVTTTHAGVQDSEAQADANDPVFHNHYVALEDLVDDATCPGLQVRDISFQEPGDVDVSGHGVVMEDTPHYFGGTHSLTKAHISFNEDTDKRADLEVSSVVSFTINPVDSDGNTTDNPTEIAAVCINDVKAAGEDHVTVIPASYWEN